MTIKQLRSRPQGTTTIIATLVLVGLLLMGAYLVLRQPNSDESDVNTAPTSSVPEESTQTPAASSTADQSANTIPITAPASGDATTTVPINTPAPAVKSFTVTAKNFSFSPSEIRVKKGDRVAITLSNESGFHDFVLDEFSARTPRIQSGDSAEVDGLVAVGGEHASGLFEIVNSLSLLRQRGEAA